LSRYFYLFFQTYTLTDYTPMAYIFDMIIIETPIFTKLVAATLQDEEYRLLTFLMQVMLSLEAADCVS